MKIPTVKIAFGNGFVIINRSDFDSSKHQLFSDEDVSTPSPVAESETASPNPLAPTREAREAELIGLYFGDSRDQANWRPIKRIADGHSIEKPDAGWDEAIPLILSAEFDE